MLETLKHSLKAQNILFEKESRASHSILIAVSGGRDSMCLLHAMIILGFNPEVAHINYELRGSESDQDQALVSSFCEAHRLKLHVKSLDLKSHLELHGGNLQEEARNLRYKFFDELDHNSHYAYILTGHHLQDQLENILIHTFRGIGPKLIPELNGKRYRPLIHTPAHLIAAYAECEKVTFRTDHSNLTDDYDRNFIRNNILPLLSNRDPDIQQKLLGLATSWGDDQALINQLISNQMKVDGERLELNKDDINSAAHCYHLLKPFGYSRKTSKDIYAALPHIGAKFETKSYALIIDRALIIIESKQTGLALDTLELEQNEIPFDKKLSNFKSLKISVIKNEMSETRNSICVPKELIHFPITIRHWVDGDSFQPKGMNGGKKKIKKLFVDHKVNRFDKQQIPILFNGSGEIIWVMGLQKDERFDRPKHTGPFLCFEYANA